MTDDRRRVLRGVAGVAGLLGAVVGVPVGLVTLGQPVPSAVPGGRQVSDGLSRPISDSALLRAAGVVCWLVWAAFVVAVAIEVVAAASRGRSGRSHLLGVPGLQRMARTLVLTAALLLPQRGAPGAVAAPVAPAPAALVSRAVPPVHHRSAPEVGEDDRPVGVHRPSVPGGTVRHVVQRYDSPWAIAERHLGDGTRWRELRDAEGRSLERTRSKARLIHPGEIILVPQPAAPAPAAARTAPAGLAAAAPAAPAVTAAAPPVAPADPVASTGPRAPEPAAPEPGSPAPTMQSLPPVNPPEMLDVTSERRPAAPGPVAGSLLEAGMAGAAVLALLGVLRRRQAQRRPPGRRIRLPGPQLALSELAVRSSDTGDRVALAGAAVDLLAGTLQDAGAALPTVLGVLVDEDAVEILLDRPAAAPDPWTASAEGFRWRIASTDIDVAATPRSAPLPALTSLGRAAAGYADVLINLEAAGLVAIAGERARAAAVLHAMATHLCGAPWAGAVDVVLIGLPPALAIADRVRTAASITAVRDDVRSTAEVMSATMAGLGCADAFQGRVRGMAADGWPPTVVLCAAPMTAAEWAWLHEVTRPGSGVAAVIAGAGPGPADVDRWVIDADANPMPVDPLRLAVQPAALDGATMADICELLEIGRDDSGATLAEPPYDRIEVSVEVERPDRPGLNGNHPDRPPRLPDPEILVRVLGTVDVVGATEFKRAKGRELIVYLAMHPHGVGEAELDEALWPSSGGRVVAAPTRDSTVSVARRAVGGPARLLPAMGQGREKRYQLGPGVRSDWERFCVLYRWGRDRSSVAALRLALETVRGRPFEGVISGRTYGWIHTEGHGRHIEAEVGDAAELAAGLYLRAGDAVGARWAARRGLMADPYTERLWVRLMEAADLLGESQEVERVMDELDVVLGLEGDFSGLHPNTLAAYDRLSRRHRFPAGR